MNNWTSDIFAATDADGDANDTLFNIHFDGKPLEFGHWYLFACLLFFLIWNTFTTFYFSRIVGPVFAFILTRLYRLKGSNVHFSLGSFSVSPISGKVMFRDFSYTCCDYSIHCNDGYIKFSYWRYVTEKPSPRASSTSRVHVTLNGLQIHVFNRLSEYTKLAKFFGLERPFRSLKKQTNIPIPKKLTEKEEQAWDSFYDKLWCLIGYIKLSIGSGKFVAGNFSLPSMFVIIFENYSSKIYLKARKAGCDRALLCIVGTCENLSVSFVKSSEFEKKQPLNFTGRRDPPPRTMGDGFAVLQTARLHFFYNQSILGIVQDEIQSTTEHQPIWESVWRFGKNTVFSYGPWADAQRVLIYDFFFPPTQYTAPVTAMPKRGQRRIFLAHDVRISVLNDAGFDVWFMRGDELNALHLRFKQGSSVDLNIPWITLRSGYSTFLRCCLLFVDSSTSLPCSKFCQCETFRLSLVVQFPRVFNAHQLWKYEIELNKLTTWFVWDHKRFLSDLINEWSSEASLDLYKFVPCTWDFRINITDSFELIFMLNDKNWVDTKLYDTPENALLALVGRKAKINFFLPFVDFCAETINTVYEIKAEDSIALRVWLPPSNPMFPILHSLLKNSKFVSLLASSAGLPTCSSLAENWLEVWRSEELKILFDYVYHPVYNGYSSDLPYNVVTSFLPKVPSHPFKLTPDELLIEITIAESEVVLIGTLIKLILDLKDNYFGVYDQISEIGSAKANVDWQRPQTNEKILAVEALRPLNLRFCLRLLRSIAHCAVYCRENSLSGLGECPLITVNELVIELVKNPLALLVQVNIGSALMQFGIDSVMKCHRGGFLSLNTFSLRGQGFYSELDVPWDFGSIEYAWLMEMVIGNFCGCLTPVQFLSLSELLESLILLITSPDEELLTPERYQLCQHFNDIHTCPLSALCLVDANGRVQNCESEEKLKYKLVRVSIDSFVFNLTDGASLTKISVSPVRFCFCNCHNASFCENVMLRIPLITVKQYVQTGFNENSTSVWLECTSLLFSDLTLDICLPYSQNSIHLFQERRMFLLKHDRSTTRLYFLWNDRKKSCACYGYAEFFAQKDSLGEVFMDPCIKFVTEGKGFTRTPKQPIIEQSIIYGCKSVFAQSAQNLKIKCTDAFISRQHTYDTTGTQPDETSEESFYSAISSNFANFVGQMTSPILSSPLLLSSYTKFLRSGHIRTASTDSIVATDTLVSSPLGIFFFEETIKGINALKISCLEKKRSSQGSKTSPFSTSSAERVPADIYQFTYGSDKFVLYVRGSLTSHVQFFITPLSLEILERIVSQYFIALMTTHPALIVQHIYAFCSFSQHTQPLTKTPETEPKEKQQIFCDISLPDIHGIFFQCGLSDIKLQPEQFLKPRYSIGVLNIQKSLVLVSTRRNLEEDMKFCVDCEHVNLNAQILDLNSTGKPGLLTNNMSPSIYYFEGRALGLTGKLENYNLKNIVDVRINDVSLYFNSGPTASPHRPNSDKNYAQITISSIELCSQIWQSLGQGNRKQRPFCEVVTPFAASWASSIWHLKSTLHSCLLQADRYIDLQIIKLLITVLACDDKQVFLCPYSCFSEVRAKPCNHLSCPSCLLALTLLRYCMNTNISLLVEKLDSFDTRALEAVRKPTMVALLSHWQAIIAPQVQLADSSVAKEFVERARNIRKELKIHIGNNNGKPSSADNGDRGARSANENRQMDLYHWISARRREHREANRKYIYSARTLDDPSPVDPMEITLLAFFWPLFRKRKLASSGFDSFPFESINLLFSLELSECKIDLIEPRMVSSSSLNYISVVRDSLFQMEAFSIRGHAHGHIHLDEMKLRPVRFSAEVSHISGIQNARLALSWTSVYLLKDVLCMIRSVRTLITHLDVHEAETATLKNLMNDDGFDYAAPCEVFLDDGDWVQKALSKFCDYKRSVGNFPKYPLCSLHFKFDGSVGLRVVMLEVAFTQLFLSTTFKKLEVVHKILRERQKSETIILDDIIATVQRANLILSELVSGLDARHILNSSVNTNSFQLKRVTSANGSLHSFLNVNIGDIEGDIPMHAENLHEVVLRNAPKLNEQITLLEEDELTGMLFEDSDASSKARKHLFVIHFAVNVNSVELDALILPSLRAKYHFDKAVSHGKTGYDAEFSAEVKSHRVNFTVLAPADHRSISLSSDTFQLPLPFIVACGKYRIPSTNADNIDDAIKYYEGRYFDIDLTIGKMDYVITTDLLNQILFAEKCFRSELFLFLDRLVGNRVPSNTASAKELKLVAPSLLYTVQMHGESYPWLQLTACTPTATAVRLTCGNIAAILTNRWVRKDSDDKTVLERLYWKVVINISAKLGQLVKTAMFAEIETELQEFASFATQITLQNKDSHVHSSYNYLITVNRPVLLIKSTAIDKAILLWLNYKNTYNYWHEERDKVLKTKQRLSFSATPFGSSPIVEPEMNVSLSLKVTDGAYVCMPLYSPDLNTNMSALVISLKSTDVTVCVRKELACQAAFHNFKVQILDNFDEQALSDEWLKKDPNDLSRSNYFFFPEGTYQFVSQASDVGPNNERARWTLSVKWQMKGMVIDLDQRIGKLMSLLIRTFSSMATGDSDDVWDGSIKESLSLVSNGESDHDDDINEDDELENLVEAEDGIKKIEKKMQEQSDLVMSLMQYHASETAIEQERRKLRRLEIARFRIFRSSWLKKLKRSRPKEAVSVVNKTESSKNAPGITKTHARTSSSGSAALVAVDLSRNQSTSRLSDAGQERSVDMNIDVQISVESGSCTLRAVAKQEDNAFLVKRLSAKDLKTKGAGGTDNLALTNLAIPSVDVKAYYTSLDSNFTSSLPRHLHAKLSHRMLKQSSRKKPAFYLAIELSSMPQESLITPNLADYLEQLLEPLPQNSFFESSTNLDSVRKNGEEESDVPIMEMDTSSLPIDVLFHLIVQSSTIRFEGQQVRSAAADCLLKLPSLTLVASTKSLVEIPEVNDQEISGSGIHLSATLNAFSLNVYSPHQQATAHDALSLTLDRLCLVTSRSKNAKNEQDNKVQFVLTANIGSANFNYDMRRLAELISFPKPWYRKNIIRRLFIGEHSFRDAQVKRSPSTLSDILPVSAQGAGSPSSPAPVPQTSFAESWKKKEWKASVLLAVEWKQFDINAQMANTMGNTKLVIRDGVLQGFCELNSRTEKNICVNFRLKSSSLISHGGAISGQITVLNLDFNCAHKSSCMQAPENQIKMKFDEIECRVEWMSRSIFIGRCLTPSLVFLDEWMIFSENEDRINRVTVSVNINCSWNDLEMIITKMTVDDFKKISDKLHSFFREQMSNSRQVWGIKEESIVDESNEDEQDSKSLAARRRYRHWPDVLDALTEIQSKYKIIPMPVGEEGVTSVGGSIELTAGHISFACMNGEMNATSWALFYMREVSVIFLTEAQYSFISANNDIGVLVSQRITWKLGELSTLQQETPPESLAVVCRVQQGRGSMMRQTSSIGACLDHMIGDVLKQLKLYPKDVSKPMAHHVVLPLFQFPAFDAVFTSVQEQETDIDNSEAIVPEIRSSLICEFHDTVNVQTDFNAQVSFLPELLKTYMKNDNRTAEEKVADVGHDFRRYICETWLVDPKIRFIDRFKWNPPVIDEILRKLQIFDHRMTIPKALQRGLLDPCDALLAQTHSSVLALAKKTSSKLKFC